MKKPYYIDYPQETVNGQMHRYQCVFCKVETTTINGQLEGHLPNCDYRKRYEAAGHDAIGACTISTMHDADDYD